MGEDPNTLRLGWNRKLEHHVKAPNERRIQSVNRVGEPQRWNRVFLKRPVDPGLPRLRGAISPKEVIAVVKHILNFVKKDERPALCEKALCRAQCTQPTCATDGVTIVVLASDLEQFASQFLRQHLGKLALACARGSVDEDIDALAPRFD